jgi:hypothetical protein
MARRNLIIRQNQRHILGAAFGGTALIDRLKNCQHQTDSPWHVNDADGREMGESL